MSSASLGSTPFSTNQCSGSNHLESLHNSHETSEQKSRPTSRTNYTTIKPMTFILTTPARPASPPPR